jgi:GT2 family glycosyltransferase
MNSIEQLDRPGATSAVAADFLEAPPYGPTRGTAMQTVSVVIRVRNAAGDLQRCLTHLRRQALPPNTQMQIVAVDNESSDASADVARRFGADVISMPANRFTWGRALNAGIEAAGGEIVVLLSADACPANRQYLAEMLRPFEDSRVAVAYGRQVPKADAPIDEIARLAEMFGKKACKCDVTGRARGGEMPMSNACAAVRRSAWEVIHYDEAAVASEELSWTNCVLRSGWLCVYTPSAMVFHSHKDPFMRFVLRAVEFVVQRKARMGLQVNPRDMLGFVWCHARNRLRNILRIAAPARAKLEGLIRLPFEIVGIFGLGLLARDKSTWNRIRCWGWA